VTLIGHAALGAAIYGVARPRAKRLWGMTRRTLLLCCLLLPMLPDADVVMHTWVKYGHPLGHRGFTHSLLFCIVVGIVVALLLAWRRKLARDRASVVKASALFITLLASHALTDSMTTGGKPPMLMWPLSTEGTWAPSRVIPVSPMGKNLLRTEWNDKRLAKAKRRRAKLLRSKKETHWLVRRVVGWSERPDHARRLQVLGVALTEILYMAPLALLAGFLIAYRRRRPPDDDDDDDDDEPEPEAPEPWTAPPWWTRWWFRVASGGAAVGIFVLLGTSVHTCGLDSDVHIEDGTLADDYRTPYRHLVPEHPADGAPVAVLVHGWRCSHQLMLPMARMLARNGVESYVIDLPGHADSPIPLDTSCSSSRKTPCREELGRLFKEPLQRVLANMADAGMFEGRPLTLVGHSSGGIAVAEVALSPPQNRPARVIVEGKLRRMSPGRNQLFVGRASRIKKIPGLVAGSDEGSFDDNSARRVARVQDSHLALVRNRRVNKEVLAWIEGYARTELGDDPRHHYRTYVFMASIAAVLAVFGWIVGLGYASRRGWLPTTAPLAPSRPWLAFVCVLFGGLAAALWAGELYRSGEGWQMAKLRMTVPYFLGLASIAVVIPYVAIGWRPRRPELGVVARDVAVGLLATVALLGAFGVVADAHFFHLLPAGWRLPSVLGWTLAFLPVTLVVREVGPRREGFWAAFVALLARFVTWGTLLAVHALGRNSTGAAEAMSVLGVILAAEVMSVATETFLRRRLASAVTVAFAMAWALVAAYPVLTSTTL